ncbi:MAG TPA: PAS domain S-box protein, partial [Ectothiorhodospiraceae bacterium]|nr:PAS domain S-box protein [Ectothiorhodospiraceae bacterium]
MKKNLPITGKEVQLSEESTIISTTDMKGRITYVNKEFINISGFSEDELVGQSHNVVRHPDMPAEAFKDLWETIQAGDPWRGIVKNRCKNG